MNRRTFLQFLGAAIAGAALPQAFAGEKIARAPAWATQVTLWRCPPLEPGTYTFSAFSNLGLYVGGVTAKGGETLFEIPTDAIDFHKPKLVKGGICIQGSTDFFDRTVREADDLVRGEPVRKA